MTATGRPNTEASDRPAAEKPTPSQAPDVFTLGAFGVIFDDRGRVLLCRRRDMDVWNLPGGGVLHGELPSEAVIREVREETGLNVAVRRLIAVYGKRGEADFAFTFECVVQTGSPVPTTEASDVTYFELDRIPANTIQAHVQRIRDTLREVSEPIARWQTGIYAGSARP